MMDGGAQRWQFWVDRGGTFTDVIARDPAGLIRVAKLLSENPGHYADAAVAAMRQLTGVEEGPLPPIDLRIGTTVATNALLERRGEPTLLVITRGFADALLIGHQERPDLFVRRIDRPSPLYDVVVEIDERLTASGEVIRPLDTAAATALLAEAYGQGLRSVAIVLMHGFRFPAHEQALAEIAGSIGFDQISVSHQVAPLIKLIGRGDTTVADAYLSPVLHRYVAGLREEAGPQVDMLFMQSNGGLTSGDSFCGKDAVLSGPAGGIVGMARTAAQAGQTHVIGFDMGGTSTDVSHYAGQFERDSETRIGGVRLRAPMMRIHTVAAGGGSICRFDGTRLTVGPHSAGAVPGPASYRRGGPLTVTDCNVLLGKIQPDHFPHLFGPDGDQPLDVDRVRSLFDALVAEIAHSSGRAMTPEQAAEGLIAIAVANMANAIKKISVERGHDIALYTLACFGGAGGQHACLVADALGMQRVMIHPLAGVLSAYGMGLADRRAVRERTVALPLCEESMDVLSRAAADLAAEAEADLRRQGVSGAVRCDVTLHLRPAAAESLIELTKTSLADLRAAFDIRHRALFGFASSGEIIVDMIRCEAVQPGEEQGISVPQPALSAAPLADVRCHMAGTTHQAPLYDRATIAAGCSIAGPAIIVDAVSTTVVEPGWTLTVDAIGNLLLARDAPSTATAIADLACDPVRLEIMGGLFMAIAEEMGAALQQSATSVNIRERLDFSCALFDASGSLVANAPHMPVHLGSMGESVRTIVARRGNGTDGTPHDGRGMRRGDVYALNAPYDGGTHLPDITVIMPVFAAGQKEPAFFVAARGHHADIGGISPGSMPPDSRSLDEEGVLIDNVLLVEDGRFLDAEMRTLLSAGRWPSRNVDQNIADLKAQVAACTKGADELIRISGTMGTDYVQAYMRHVQDYSETAVRGLIDQLDDGSFRYAMDDGHSVSVAVRVDRTSRSVTFDFAGSSAQHPGNFNAPLPVVRAAVLYVVRTLIDEAVPMNEGCLRPVRIIVPEGCLLSPRYPAAVVAGNVETSQVVTDALFGALGVMAAAQGTMNNLTFGNARYQYYETIAGGSGAGPDFHGTAVVQTHMTNSRLTDPEILETRFPVMVDSFAVRRGTGGRGRHMGGDGALRQIRFLEPMSAGILSNRRVVPPFGLAGGASGAPGCNWVLRANGRRDNLASTATAELAAGDAIVIETPGGGGFGPPD